MVDRAATALHAIPATLPHGDWVKAGMAAHAAGLSLDDFDQWSATGDNYDSAACKAAWRSFKPGTVTEATLYYMAAEHGWTDSNKDQPVSHKPAPRLPPQAKPTTDPLPVWSRLETATNQHPYIQVKGATAVPLDSLRVVPAGDPLRIMGESMAGALAVPCFAADGALRTIQFFAVGAAADRLKDQGKPTKLSLAGAGFGDGWHTVGEIQDGQDVAVCEGLGTAWAAWKATGKAAVVTFGFGRTKAVADALRQRYPNTRIVLCPDAGKEGEALTIAAAVGASVAAMPEGWPNNSDLHDLGEADGLDVVAMLLETAKSPAAAPLPLGIVFADELGDTFTPPDELVEGVLTAGAGSILYGDSNSGKTFLAVDMACAIARGVPWMGRRTERGLVIYVAAESPASIRGRLQAYQQHHGCKVPGFAIVQHPINLYDTEADTEALIQAVKSVERHTGQRAALVIGDTLARLSAGANENSGEDMGVVVKHFDRIRIETGAHFLLIHHCGKDAAKGARGHSSLRAAVDTEIEVTDTPQGRCAEMTKQRDLSSKGERIGFALELVTMGVTKWGQPAVTCVVTSTEAPLKAAKAKRMGKCEGAVVEYLASMKVGVRKSKVAKHFDGRYDRSNIYRAMKALMTAGAIHEAAGMVCIASAAK